MAKSCYEYAMDVLSKYPKTEKELRIKMYQQGYDSQIVMRTLEKLKLENFLNDKMFAESYLNSEVMRKGKPLFLVQQKLTMKGIDPKIIAELSNQFAEDIQPNQEGLYMATLVDQDNVRCEMWFVDGELHRLVELDK